MVLLARVSSNPPSPVPLLQTSQVWVPVCFRVDNGLGALGLGVGWGLGLGAGCSLAFALEGVCPQAPATFPNVRDPTARLPSSPTRFIQRLL